MSVRRRFLAIALPLAALAAPASSLLAQGRQLFNWSGRVDREVQISMRGREMWTSAGSLSDRVRGRSDVDSPLPRQDGEVRVRVEDGRGDVDVIQQPTSRNDYTTVVRVRDRSGGSDRYRITAYWTPWNDRGYGSNGGRDTRGGYGGYGGYGRGRGDDRGQYGDREEDRGGYYGRGGNGGGNGAVSLAHWSGQVDGELEIRMRGEQVTYNTVSGNAPHDVRLDGSRSGMPQREATVRIANAQGRGNITVVQQPSAYNGYTTIVRVRDPQSGYGYYDFDLVWR
jgi:hypothetical protein